MAKSIGPPLRGPFAFLLESSVPEWFELKVTKVEAGERLDRFVILCGRASNSIATALALLALSVALSIIRDELFLQQRVQQLWADTD